MLIALLCEVLFITMDLGHMFRIYRFLITPSFTSLMTWMFVFTNAMLVIYAPRVLLICCGRTSFSWAQDQERPGQKIYRLLTLGKQLQ